MDLPAIRGMALKCKLISLKVLDDFGQGLVSQIIRALRWVIEVNRQADQLLIHGVSLALGYPYEHELYACGQSPLCIEVDRLVKSGVVAVTAAAYPASNWGDAEQRIRTDDCRSWQCRACDHCRIHSSGESNAIRDLLLFVQGAYDGRSDEA
jgi:hypothetical protein